MRVGDRLQLILRQVMQALADFEARRTVFAVDEYGGFRHGLTRANERASATGRPSEITEENVLALRELEAAARLCLAELLAFHNAAVAREESGLLQGRPQVWLVKG